MGNEIMKWTGIFLVIFCGTMLLVHLVVDLPFAAWSEGSVVAFGAGLIHKGAHGFFK